MNVVFSDISGIDLTVAGISGINVVFTNINYREEMKYSTTADLTAGTTTEIPTDIATEPYSIEFIDMDGNVITTGLGEPVLSNPSGVYIVTVFSAIAYTGLKVKILY